MDNSSSDGLGDFFGSEPSAPASPTPASVPSNVPTAVEVPIGPDPNVVLDPALTPPAPVATPAPQPEPPRPQTVPLPELLEQRHRYQAEKAAREAAERYNQQLEALLRERQQPQYQQPPPPPIDPVAEPERAFALLQQQQAQMAQALAQEVRAVEERTQRTLLNERLNMSEQAARAKFGSAVVDQARDAILAAGMAPMFLNQPDPYAAGVTWFQAQQLANEVGADPAAYRAKIAAEERARIVAEMRQGRQPSSIPPSVSAATNSAAAPQGVVSTRDFFNQMGNEPLRKRTP